MTDAASRQSSSLACMQLCQAEVSRCPNAHTHFVQDISSRTFRIFWLKVILIFGHKVKVLIIINDAYY